MPSRTLRVPGSIQASGPIPDDARCRRRHSHGGPWERDACICCGPSIAREGDRRSLRGRDRLRWGRSGDGCGSRFGGQGVLRGQDDDMVGRDVDRQALAFPEPLRLRLECQGRHRPVVRPPEVDLADLAEEDQAFDRRGESVRVERRVRRRGPAPRAGARPSPASRLASGPASDRPIRRPSGVRTTRSPRGSVDSTCPWIRLIGPRNRATKASTGRL